MTVQWRVTIPQTAKYGGRPVSWPTARPWDDRGIFIRQVAADLDCYGWDAAAGQHGVCPVSDISSDGGEPREGWFRLGTCADPGEDDGPSAYINWRDGAGWLELGFDQGKDTASYVHPLLLGATARPEQVAAAVAARIPVHLLDDERGTDMVAPGNFRPATTTTRPGQTTTAGTSHLAWNGPSWHTSAWRPRLAYACPDRRTPAISARGPPGRAASCSAGRRVTGGGHRRTRLARLPGR